MVRLAATVTAEAATAVAMVEAATEVVAMADTAAEATAAVEAMAAAVDMEVARRQLLTAEDMVAGDMAVAIAQSGLPMVRRLQVAAGTAASDMAATTAGTMTEEVMVEGAMGTPGMDATRTAEVATEATTVAVTVRRRQLSVAHPTAALQHLKAVIRSAMSRTHGHLPTHRQTAHARQGTERLQPRAPADQSGTGSCQGSAPQHGAAPEAKQKQQAAARLDVGADDCSARQLMAIRDCFSVVLNCCLCCSGSLRSTVGTLSVISTAQHSVCKVTS